MQKAYFIGGAYHQEFLDSIESLDCTTDSLTVSHMVLSEKKIDSAAASNKVDAYVFSGYNHDNSLTEVTEKINYDSESLTTLNVGIEPKADFGTWQNTHCAYLLGGWIIGETDAIIISSIEKFLFATQSTSILETGIDQETVGIATSSTLSKGFGFGGLSYNENHSDVALLSAGVSFTWFDESRTPTTVALSVPRNDMTSTYHEHHAYFCGGHVPDTTRLIEAFDHHTENFLTESYQLSVGRAESGGTQSTNAGYIGGGAAQSSLAYVDKIDFDSRQISTLAQGLHTLRHELSATAKHLIGEISDDHKKGYLFGGAISHLQKLATIESLKFSTQQVETVATTLHQPLWKASAVGNDQFAFISNDGIDNPSYWWIERFQWFGEIRGSTQMALSLSRKSTSPINGAYRGYWCGGIDNQPSTLVDRITYSTEDVVPIVGQLGQAVDSATSFESADSGWVFSGNSVSAQPPAFLNKLTIDTESLMFSQISMNAYVGAAVNSLLKAYISGSSINNQILYSFAFDTETFANTGFQLSEQQHAAGLENSTQGFVCGGLSGAASTARISQIDFLSEAVSVLGVSLENPKAFVASANAYHKEPIVQVTPTPTISITPSTSYSNTPSISRTTTRTASASPTATQLPPTPTPSRTPTQTPRATKRYGLLTIDGFIVPEIDISLRVHVPFFSQNIGYGQIFSSCPPNHTLFTAYTYWGGDNVKAFGYENVLINFNKLVEDFPNQEEYAISFRTTGQCSVNFVIRDTNDISISSLGIQMSGNDVLKIQTFCSSPQQLTYLIYTPFTNTYRFSTIPPTVTQTPSKTAFPTPTTTKTISATATQTPSPTPTQTETPSQTTSSTQTPSPTRTKSPTPSTSSTPSMSGSPSPTPTPSASATATGSATATLTLTQSKTPTPSVSQSSALKTPRGYWQKYHPLWKQQNTYSYINHDTETTGDTATKVGRALDRCLSVNGLSVSYIIGMADAVEQSVTSVSLINETSMEINAYLINNMNDGASVTSDTHGIWTRGNELETAAYLHQIGWANESIAVNNISLATHAPKICSFQSDSLGYFSGGLFSFIESYEFATNSIELVGASVPNIMIPHSSQSTDLGFIYQNQQILSFDLTTEMTDATHMTVSVTRNRSGSNRSMTRSYIFGSLIQNNIADVLHHDTLTQEPLLCMFDSTTNSTVGFGKHIKKIIQRTLTPPVTQLSTQRGYFIGGTIRNPIFFNQQNQEDLINYIKTADKIDFITDTVEPINEDISLTKKFFAIGNSMENGYSLGGQLSENTPQTVEKFDFTTEEETLIGAEISEGSVSSVGTYSQQRCYATHFNSISKNCHVLRFSDETILQGYQSLNILQRDSTPSQSRQFGYYFAGLILGQPSRKISKISFSSETIVPFSNNISTASANGFSLNDIQKTFISTVNAFSKQLDIFDFASETTQIEYLALQQSQGKNLQSCQNDVYGYVGGSDYLIEKLRFDNKAVSVLNSNLTQGRIGGRGLQAAHLEDIPMPITATPLPVTPSSSITPSPSSTATITITQSATISPTPTPSNTTTPSLSATQTQTPSASFSGTRTPNPTPSSSRSSTASNTPTHSPSPSTSESPTPTRTATGTGTGTRTPTPTSTATGTASETPSQTATQTSSQTPSRTPNPTGTPTRTPSGTQTLTASPTPSSTETLSATPTPTSTKTLSATATPTSTPSTTATETASATTTPSESLSPSTTRTLSATPTPSASTTASATNTPSISATQSVTPTISLSMSPIPSWIIYVHGQDTDIHTSSIYHKGGVFYVNVTGISQQYIGINLASLYNSHVLYGHVISEPNEHTRIVKYSGGSFLSTAVVHCGLSQPGANHWYEVVALWLDSTATVSNRLRIGGLWTYVATSGNPEYNNHNALIKAHANMQTVNIADYGDIGYIPQHRNGIQSLGAEFDDRDHLPINSTRSCRINMIARIRKIG